MRLKTFHAKSLADAMLLVREQLGENAIIVSTHDATGPEGARVIAAVERPELDEPVDDRIDFEEVITAALERHGAPPELTDRIISETGMIEESDPARALAHALSSLFQFSPLALDEADKRYILIGPPGTGKTVTCAKMAAEKALVAAEEMSGDDGKENALPVTLIAADTHRLGAVEQLGLYADRLGTRFSVARDSAELKDALSLVPDGDLVLIDTAGTNPFDLEELAEIVTLVETDQIDPILVLGAGRDYEEASDLAKAFRPVRPTRLLITGFDIARKLGSMLAAADAGELAFSSVSRSPNIADGLQPLDAEELARLLMKNNNPTRSNGRSPGLSDEAG